MARAVIYCRVSSRGQQDNTSFVTQEGDCRKKCEELGFKNVLVMKEVGERDELEERPVLAQLRQDMRRGSVDAVVFWKYDRLSGDPLQQAVFLYEAQKYDVAVHSAQGAEDFDDSPVGFFMRQAAAFVGKMEVNNIRMRVNRGIKERIERGEMYPHSTELYGYKWGDDRKSRYIICEPEAEVVRFIFEQVIAGISLGQIARQLTVPAPGGKHWHKAAISRIIHTSAYWGEPQAYVRRVVKVQVTDPLTGETHKVTRRKLNHTPVPVGTDSVPAIVSKQEAQQVHEAVQRNQRIARKAELSEEYLLRGGFIVCGHCGKPMRCSQHMNYQTNQRERTYECTTATHTAMKGQCVVHSVWRDEVDADAWKKALELARNPRIIRERMDAYRARYDKPDDITREAVESQLVAITKQKARLRIAIMGDGTEDADEAAIRPLVGMLNDLELQEQDARDKLSQLDSAESDWEFAQQSLEQTIAWCKDVAHQHSFSDKQRLLLLLGIQVTAWSVKSGHVPRWDICSTTTVSSRSSGRTVIVASIHLVYGPRGWIQ